MRRLITAAMTILMLASLAAPGIAQTALIPGGLTALPQTQAGPNLAQNAGFESVSGGMPAGWTAVRGFRADQLTRRSGRWSLRLDGSTSNGQFYNAKQAVQLKRGLYRLTAWIKTSSLGMNADGAGIRLVLDYRPEINDWYPSSAVRGTNDWRLVEIIVNVPEDRKAYIALEAYRGPTGTAWIDDVRLEARTLPVDAFMLYPNYRGMLFDDQSQTMRFDVRVTPPGDDFGRYAVVARLRDDAGVTVRQARFDARARLTAQLDGSVMRAGRPYQVTISLVDRANGDATVYTYPAFRVSKVPGSARASMSIAFDERNRLLVRGQPRFALGVYDSGLAYNTTDSYWESTLWSPSGARRMDGLRINFYVNYHYGTASAAAMQALMTNLQKRGVMWLQTGNCFGGSAHNATYKFSIDVSDSFVRDLGAHPGSAGYYTIDECRADLVPSAFAQYQRLKALDPDSMTFAALLGDDDTVRWRDAADVLSTDPYPLVNAEPSGGYDHGRVASWTRITRDAVQNARPFFTVLQFFKFGSAARWPTRPEMRNHAYMAIVEGARGLFWWSIGNGFGALATVCPDWCAERVSHMNNLKAVVNELAGLEPVLLADDAPGALRSVSSSAIRTKVKLHGGRGYIFAYNATRSSTSATFTWNTGPGTVTVHGENRTRPVSGTSFTDSFGPWQAHVYVIGNPGSGGSGGATNPEPEPDPGDGGTGPGGSEPGDGAGGGSAPALSAGFSNPASGATVSSTVTVTMSAAGGTPPYAFTLAVDGKTVYSGANNSTSLNTTALADGQHTLTATVRDSGNPARTATASRTITVRNATAAPPPSGTLKVSITSPTEGAGVSGRQVVNIWVGGQAPGTNTFTLKVDGKVVATQRSSSNHVWPSWDSTTVADGRHTLTAEVRDAAGNTGTKSISVTTRNGVAVADDDDEDSAPLASPPMSEPLRVVFTRPDDGTTVSGTTAVQVAASGGSGGYTYQLTVDGTPAGTGSSLSWDTTRVADGQHTLGVTATDADGARATATLRVTVANGAASPPSSGTLKVSITSPTDEATVSGSQVVNVWVGGATGSKTYRLLVGGQEVARQTSTATHVWPSWDTRRHPNGRYSLTAEVRDGTGNVGTRTIAVTVRN